MIAAKDMKIGAFYECIPMLYGEVLEVLNKTDNVITFCTYKYKNRFSNNELTSRTENQSCSFDEFDSVFKIQHIILRK